LGKEGGEVEVAEQVVFPTNGVCGEDNLGRDLFQRGRGNPKTSFLGINHWLRGGNLVFGDSPQDPADLTTTVLL